MNYLDFLWYTCFIFSVYFNILMDSYIKNSNIEFTIACILGVIKYNNVITEQI